MKTIFFHYFTKIKIQQLIIIRTLNSPKRDKHDTISGVTTCY